MFRVFCIALFSSLVAETPSARGQTPVAPVTLARPPRPTPPTRDAHTPGYVTAKDLPDGENAPVKEDGNFILGPTHTASPETAAKEGVPQGTVSTFTMESIDSKIYPGIARDFANFDHLRRGRTVGILNRGVDGDAHGSLPD